MTIEAKCTTSRNPNPEPDMWTVQGATSILASEIPRRWMRLANPIVLFAGEGEDARIDISPGLFADTPTEPVANDGRRMGDKQWAEFCRRYVFPPPSAETVEKIIHRTVAGQVWTERLDALSHQIDSFERLAKTLTTAYSRGASREEIVSQVKPHVRMIASSARRIARTEGLRIANAVQLDQYHSLGDMVAGVQILATLDENTRPHHAARNGTVYWYDRRRRPSIDQLPVLPDEPNCRCFDSPVLKEPEEFKNDPALRAEFQNAAGAMIPDPSVYTQWFERADRGRRMMAVGVKRYQSMEKQLAGQREPQWTDFIDPEGRLLGITALRAETPQQRAARLREVQAAIAKRGDLLNKINQFGFVPSEPQPRKTKTPEGTPRVRFPGPNKPRIWRGEKSIPNRKALEEVVESLPAEDRRLLEDYTRFNRGRQVNWQQVNAKLLRGEPLQADESAAQESLRRVLREAAPLPRVTTIHRGLSLDQSSLNALLSTLTEASVKGEPFAFRSNSSASLNPERALKYATKPGRERLLFEIKARTGIYMQRITTQGDDFEILQGDFVRYNVVRTQRFVPYGPRGELVTVVQLQEI